MVLVYALVIAATCGLVPKKHLFANWIETFTARILRRKPKPRNRFAHLLNKVKTESGNGRQEMIQEDDIEYSYDESGRDDLIKLLEELEQSKLKSEQQNTMKVEGKFYVF